MTMSELMNELLVEQRIEALRSADPAVLKMEAEARAERGGGLRRALATALVRLGARLDGNAPDRAGFTPRQASQH
jgi:hypothetical protein